MPDERATASRDEEIAAARACASTTLRATSQAMEDMLFKVMPVLDHGFLRVVDYMGNDGSIVQAARTSYGRGTRRVSDDATLIKYLMRHRHTTPFEIPRLVVHARLPLFVARQWVRHRHATLNEASARYSIMDREFYIPAAEHLAAQSSVNRQGRGALLEGEEAREVLALLRDDAERNYGHYERMLNERPDGTKLDDGRQGLARELARMNLTLNAYTQWYWATDLHNLFRFLGLRADPHAQYEIRAYADVLLDIVAKWVPAAHGAFMDYQLNAFSLSGRMVEAVRAALRGETVDRTALGLGKREAAELAAAIPELAGKLS